MHINEELQLTPEIYTTTTITTVQYGDGRATTRRDDYTCRATDQGLRIKTIWTRSGGDGRRASQHRGLSRLQQCQPVVLAFIITMAVRCLTSAGLISA